MPALRLMVHTILQQYRRSQVSPQRIVIAIVAAIDAAPDVETAQQLLRQGHALEVSSMPAAARCALDSSSEVLLALKQQVSPSRCSS